MMKLSTCKGGFGICVIDPYNPIYNGIGNAYKKRLDMMLDASHRGSFFMRCGAGRGFFEFEFTSAGRKEYNAKFPIKNVETKPTVNSLWLDEFTELLKDFKATNMLPFLFFIGGCDFPDKRDLILDPRKESHWPALKLYVKTVVKTVKEIGLEGLYEPGNEWYALPYMDPDRSAGLQVRLCDYMYEIGVPYGNMRMSGLDGGHKITYAEYLQTNAFGPEKFEDVTNPEARRKFCLRRGINEKYEVVSHRLGISLHEIERPEDTGVDGTAARARIFGYANYNIHRFGPVAYSTDGTGKTATGYSGVPADKLPALYKALYPDFMHGLAGGVGFFEDLPQDERITVSNPSSPNGVVVKSMNFGPKFKAHLDAMAKTYKELTGKDPYNKLHPVTIPDPVVPEPDVPGPVTPGPDVPEPTPTPDPVQPDPQEDEVYFNLIGKKLLDWRIKEWLKKWKENALRTLKFTRDNVVFFGSLSIICFLIVLIIKAIV